MKKEEPLPGRRALLRGAAGLSLVPLATTAGCFSSQGSAPPAAGPAAGAPALSRPQKPSAYRLRPLTGYGPARGLPAAAPVRSKPILRLASRDRTMVLTFDDGPDPRYTPGILRTLRQYDVRAMFFVCGEMAAASPDLLREMIDDGHVIGNHTWTHPQLLRLGRAAVRSEIESTSEVVRRTVGEAPLWFRAPYGAWNRAAFEIGAGAGMEPLAWTTDSLDWTEPGTRKIVDNVLRGAGSGVVVLNHDAGGNRSQSVDALRIYLPRLLDDGYRFGLPRRRSV
ncbi:polysaccharide deacetylase family protein [Streptomyces indicus]|uniref:Peptidoglycan/xylan/chitin deacetylase, PgdA/CDA1 family n=1 Tax=Streptomyces indicus TaxID=417292 RepID=A0A1G8TY66_9ACTN|nr:polysaccharide deacetylase family protein [Streptomyces indicus]SDJ46449.1 Peptidoglycan/xylan/chitin deacetylase, PgdA/CDA1 family [Streptomyces indicus]